LKCRHKTYNRPNKKNDCHYNRTFFIFSNSNPKVKIVVGQGKPKVGEDGKVKNTYYYIKSPYSIQCGESEVKKTYQMYAIGTNNVTSEPTEAISVWVR